MFALKYTHKTKTKHKVILNTHLLLEGQNFTLDVGLTPPILRHVLENLDIRYIYTYIVSLYRKYIGTIRLLGGLTSTNAL